MFGIGFFEILIILVVAVIFLGPDKLPQAIVDFVKFFKAVKKSINEAKDTLDKELEISKLTNEIGEIKSHFETQVDSITKDIDLANLQEIKEKIQDTKDLAKQNLSDFSNLSTNTKESLFSEYNSLPTQTKSTPANPIKKTKTTTIKSTSNPTTKTKSTSKTTAKKLPNSNATKSSVKPKATKTTSSKQAKQMGAI